MAVCGMAALSMQAKIIFINSHMNLITRCIKNILCGQKIFPKKSRN